ncbi:hypothetical protein L211DRAFT_154667 [Terfezia boudieri ATCC MYA-4762]|uniref:Uncharacterized protein n=1 Tax=Terfezia boudieri ATCC MYA-4762 TaxID=1051890 RepID=A0A3N4M3H7_9PEZI|nr:hypothetical protein L211DRAFT_154667 [Terfezia boudieri ATCC MYA-4762]
MPNVLPFLSPAWLVQADDRRIDPCPKASFCPQETPTRCQPTSSCHTRRRPDSLHLPPHPVFLSPFFPPSFSRHERPCAPPQRSRCVNAVQAAPAVQLSRCFAQFVFVYLRQNLHLNNKNKPHTCKHNNEAPLPRHHHHHPPPRYPPPHHQRLAS